MALALPPLVPKVDAILVLDGDGDRLAGKYYGDYFSSSSSSSGGGGNSNSSALQTRELRSSFEKQLQQKIAGMTARPDAAEVVTVMGRTAVFCGGPSAGGAGAGGANNALPPTTSGGGGGDVRVVHVGPPGESELVLAHLCEGMYNALSQLMGGSTDRTMVLDNLELVFLLIDEHCDGGIILETDAHKLAAAVLLRDGEDAAAMMGGGSGGAGGGGSGGPGDGMPAGAGGGGGMSSGDMTIAQALRQARQQFLAGLTTSSRDGN